MPFLIGCEQARPTIWNNLRGPLGERALPGHHQVSTKRKKAKPIKSTSPLKRTAYGIRTRVTGVKGRRPRPLDERGSVLLQTVMTARRVTEGI